MSKKSKNKPHIPSPLTLHIMGKNEAAFDVFIFNLLLVHLPELQFSDLTTRLSRDGNYISVKAIINVERKEQIDAIYRDLYENERVLMAL